MTCPVNVATSLICSMTMTSPPPPRLGTDAVTYAVRHETDGTYSVLCDGYTIATGLTNRAAWELVDYLKRLEG